MHAFNSFYEIERSLEIIYNIYMKIEMKTLLQMPPFVQVDYSYTVTSVQETTVTVGKG